MNNIQKDNVNMLDFVIWLASREQLEEAFRLLRKLEPKKGRFGDPDEETEEELAELHELYISYSDSFDEGEAPTFEEAMSELIEFWGHLGGTVNADAKPKMNAEAKAEVKEKVLMLIDFHNGVEEALRSAAARLDNKGLEALIPALIKLIDVGTVLSAVARNYGISAERVHDRAKILVDLDEAYKDSHLVRRMIRDAKFNEEASSEADEDDENG